MTKTHLMKNYLRKMAQSLYITEMCKFWQPNFTKLNMAFRQNFLLRILLVKQSHYNLRRCSDFRICSIRIVYHGSESISFLEPKIWNIFPGEIKRQTSLYIFKKSVKKWKPQDCLCKLCKVYINNVGFLSQLS